ncbi:MULTISPECIES: type I toxin-antitoxin system Fst family toxin [Bacteria]|nr:type I toxin-antitoxin system Fst family toxin [Enterococcus faecium]
MSARRFHKFYGGRRVGKMQFIFEHVLLPLLIGITLALFSHWLDRK